MSRLRELRPGLQDLYNLLSLLTSFHNPNHVQICFLYSNYVRSFLCNPIHVRSSCRSLPHVYSFLCNPNRVRCYLLPSKRGPFRYTR